MEAIGESLELLDSSARETRGEIRVGRGETFAGAAPVTGEAADLLAGYRDLPFLAKPFTFLALTGVLAPLLKERRYRPWRRPSASWRNRAGREDGVSS